MDFDVDVDVGSQRMERERERDREICDLGNRSVMSHDKMSL